MAKDTEHLKSGPGKEKANSRALRLISCDTDLSLSLSFLPDIPLAHHLHSALCLNIRNTCSDLFLRTSLITSILSFPGFGFLFFFFFF